MQHNNSPSVSGVQIENTLSMALQNGRHSGKILPLLIIALVGCFSGIFTFLSMFQPPCHEGILAGCILLCFGIFSWFALSARRLLPFQIGLFLLYGVLLVYFRSWFWNGFVHLINQVYKQIFFTDWNYFSVDETLSETVCVTVFLLFLIVPLLLLICYGVLRFQNFFLPLLATFPLVCVGFFFGIAAEHVWAFLLTAFWCSTAAVHLCNFGSANRNRQSSFWRRGNTFFPVTGMRFMVSERIGLGVLILVFGLLLITDALLVAFAYERSDTVKKLRGKVQTISADIMSGTFSFDAFMNGSWDVSSQNASSLKLGDEDIRTFEDLPISEAIFSELPGSRVYLKRYIGHLYDGRTWSTLPDYYYEDEAFTDFQRAHLFPQEFLFHAAYRLEPSQTTLTLHSETDVISSCIPYGFKMHDEITCIHDDTVESNTNTFTIFAGQDYETLFAQEDAIATFRYEEVPDIANYESMFSSFADLYPQDQVSLVAPDSSQNLNTLTASLLCADSYRDFVYDHYLQVPKTDAMNSVREQYSFLFSLYDARTATAAETIAFLQTLRNYMCSSVIYTLAPGKTPANMDFVSYFLLQNQKGYCAHYASAGTILARMAGIPARYCDGYVLDCQSDRVVNLSKPGKTAYSLQILDSNAHSWVEIYIDGVGWIPFEFTHSYFVPPAEPETTEPVTTEITVPETITTEATETQPTSPSTETPTDGTAPVHTEPEPAAARTVDPLPFLICLGIVLLLAAIALLLILWRKKALAKRRAALSQEDTQAAAHAAYRYLCQLLAYSGHPVAWKTSADLAKLLRQAVPQLSEAAVTEITGNITKLKFSPHPLSQEELQCLVQLGRRTANAIYLQASVWEKLKLLWIYHLI